MFTVIKTTVRLLHKLVLQRFVEISDRRMNRDFTDYPF